MERYYVGELGRIRLPDPYIVLIGLIVFLQFDGLYLLDADKFHTSDVSLILIAVLCVAVYAQYAVKVTYRYQWLILFSFVLAAIASYTAAINYHQPFIMGFRALRSWYCTMLLYFPIAKLLRVKRLNVDQLIGMINFFAVAYAMLGFSQFMVGSRITILHIAMGERYGSVRLWMDMTLPVLAYFIAVSMILKSEKSRIMNCCIAAMSLGLCVFVIKTRMTIVAVVVTTFIAILLQRDLVKKITTVVGFLAILFLSLSSQIGVDILDMAAGKQSSEIDTASIRQAGREFYLMHTFDSVSHFLFGNGFPNVDVAGVSEITGRTQGFNINDNGMYGLIYVYGFIFVVWVAVVHFRLIRDSFSMRLIGLPCFLITGLLGMSTLYPYCYSDFSTVVCFPIVCAIIEYIRQRA